MPRASSSRSSVPPDVGGVPLEQTRALRDQRDLGVHALLAQPRVHGECELRAGGAPTDDRDAGAIAFAKRRQRGVQTIDEAADRSGRERMLAHAGQIEPRHRRADVEARHVVRERRTPLDLDAPRLRVDTQRRGQHDPRARAARERHRVDLELRGGVVARHEPGHHARVDRLRPIDHEGHTNTLHGRHHPTTQHLDMGVSSAHQNEVRGAGIRHRLTRVRRYFPSLAPAKRNAWATVPR